jgi:hypothetical protein
MTKNLGGFVPPATSGGPAPGVSSTAIPLLWVASGRLGILNLQSHALSHQLPFPSRRAHSCEARPRLSATRPPAVWIQTRVPAFSMAVLYGDLYFYHDTHLHPSKFFFFFCIYQLVHTMNMYLSNIHTYTSSYRQCQHIVCYSLHTTLC